MSVCGELEPSVNTELACVRFCSLRDGKLLGSKQPWRLQAYMPVWVYTLRWSVILDVCCGHWLFIRPGMMDTLKGQRILWIKRGLDFMLWRWLRPTLCDGAPTLVCLPLRGTADRIYKQSWKHMTKDRLKRKLCFFLFVLQSGSAWINHYARMHLQISVPCIHMLHMSASEWVCVFLLIGDSAALHAGKVILLQYANGVLFTREICIQRLQEGLWVCKLLWGLCCLCQGRWCITENRTRQPER